MMWSKRKRVFREPHPPTKGTSDILGFQGVVGTSTSDYLSGLANVTRRAEEVGAAYGYKIIFHKIMCKRETWACFLHPHPPHSSPKPVCSNRHNRCCQLQRATTQ